MKLLVLTAFGAALWLAACGPNNAPESADNTPAAETEPEPPAPQPPASNVAARAPTNDADQDSGPPTQPPVKGSFHHYVSTEMVDGNSFYLYAPPRMTDTDNQAQLVGPGVAVLFEGCHGGVCAARAVVPASPNDTIITFSRSGDAIGWQVRAKSDRAVVADSMAHAEPGSILEQIREDALAGQLQMQRHWNKSKLGE